MAADLSDSLVYDEPWGWMQPPCHALGALNLEQVRGCALSVATTTITTDVFVSI